MQDEDPFDLLGAELKRRRIAAGLSQERLAARVGADQAQISKAETGRKFPPAALVEAIDDVLGAAGVLVDLYVRAWRARQAKTAPYRGEEDNTDRRTFVGGLGAAAILAADVSRRIANAGPDELTLDELEAEVDQIARAYSTTPHSQIAPRVIAAWRQVESALDGWTSLAVRGRVTLLAGQLTYYAGRVGFNTGDEQSARRFAVLAEQYADDVGDPSLVGSIAGLRSSIAYYAGRYRNAADFASAGRRRCHPYNQARLAAYEARAEAAAGNAGGARAALAAMSDGLWSGRQCREGHLSTKRHQTCSPLWCAIGSGTESAPNRSPGRRPINWAVPAPRTRITATRC